jgi:hypothetical protein
VIVGTSLDRKTRLWLGTVSVRFLGRIEMDLSTGGDATSQKNGLGGGTDSRCLKFRAKVDTSDRFC